MIADSGQGGGPLLPPAAPRAFHLLANPTGAVCNLDCTYCFFQSAQKFNTRYAMLGFSDQANLDQGAMWPTTYALTKLTAADEARIGALVKKAVS